MTSNATALIQISVSFRIAAAAVISGTKSTNAWRITTMANNDRKSPIQVALETLTGGCSIDGHNVRLRSDVVHFHKISIEMPQSAFWIQELERDRKKN
jgi:hypothetical protein